MQVRQRLLRTLRALDNGYWGLHKVATSLWGCKQYRFLRAEAGGQFLSTQHVETLEGRQQGEDT